MSVFGWFFFIVCLIAYAFLYIGKHGFLWQSEGWLRYYAADLLAMPIMLGISLIILRKIKMTPGILLKKRQIFWAWVLCSLHFEWLVPKISMRYTADIYDVLYYAAGAFLFAVLQARIFRGTT